MSGSHADGSQRGPAAATRSRDGLPLPDDEMERNATAWRELEDAFAFFDKGARRNRSAYLALRLVVLLAGAAVPIIALADGSRILVACVGSLVVVAEGITQLTQVHGHWIRYRRTAEAMRREALQYVSRTGPYEEGVLSRDQQLATRIFAVVGQESTAWEETVRAGTISAASPKDGSSSGPT